MDVSLGVCTHSPCCRKTNSLELRPKKSDILRAIRQTFAAHSKQQALCIRRIIPLAYRACLTFVHVECPGSSPRDVSRASARVEALHVGGVGKVEPPGAGIAFAKHSRGQDVVFVREHHLYLAVGCTVRIQTQCVPPGYRVLRREGLSFGFSSSCK